MYRRNKYLFYSLQLMAYSLIVLSSTAYAQDFKQKAPIVVNGDKVEYFHEQKRVVGTGNIFIDYEDVRLTCEKVTVYLDTREAIAEGNVKITQKDAYFTGDKINYNFDKRTGTAIDAYINYVPFYGKWQKIDKVGESQVGIEKGYMTTCDLEKPHYRIEAKKVEIYLEDKVIAKNIVAYVGNCPIMWLPYYYQPIKEQSAHITIMPGHDRDWGYYALMSMKYDYSEIFKGRYRFDYRTKNGIAVGIDNSYKLEGLGEGIANFYYADENNEYLSYKPITREEGKYRLQIRHKWQVLDDTLMTMELEKVRDDRMVKYYFYNEWEEHPVPDNYISFITSKESYTTEFLVRKRMDKYYDVVEILPEFNVNIPQYNIKYNGGSSPLYYNASFTPTYMNHTFPHSETSQYKDLNVIRVDTYNKLLYNTKPIPYLRSLYVTPFAGTRQTFYSRGKYGQTNFIRGVFDAGFDSSMKLYKIYDINTNALDLDINKLRHVITPTVSYFYTHQPTVSMDNLTQFDAIDAIKEQNNIVFQVENKLQTKRNGVSVDLVDYIIRTDYQFRLKKGVFAFNDDSDFKDQKFQYVFMQLELTPYPWLYTLAKMNINTKYGLPDSASVDFVGGKEEDRSLAFGYRYEHSFNSDIPVDPDTNGNLVNYLTTDAIYRFNEKWKARVYWRFNMDKGYIDEHQYTLSRDLHCWILEFTYDYRPYEDNKTISTQTFWVSLRLKAFPKMPLGVGRAYSRTRAGQPGDAGFIERQRLSAGRSAGY
ncbi:MAG: hypothetical protein Q8R38_06360 [Candidatus Omnitrophota bacterium]|nr:hypothetical protein [Candidatus Omnitrophota bacterium]